MKGAGFIDEATHARAKAEPLTLQKARGGFGAPHLTDFLLSQLPDRPERVETTLDRDLQREIETATAETVHALAKRLQVMLDVLDAALDVLSLDGAFLERVQETVAQLGDVERLAPIVALDNVRHDELGALERREPLAAGEALAAAAHLAALAGQARVGHLRVLKAAERTMHTCSARRGSQRSVARYCAP
jgi:hypothetical protein